MKKTFCLFLCLFCFSILTAKSGHNSSESFSYKDITPQQHAEIENLIKDVSSTLNLFYNKLSKCTPYKITDKNGERLIEIYGIENDVCRAYIEEQDCYFPNEKYKEYSKTSKKMLKNSARGNKSTFEYQAKVEELHNQYCKSKSSGDLF